MGLPLRLRTKSSRSWRGWPLNPNYLREAKSWLWTVGGGSSDCDGMNDETLNLIHQLCTRAGMIMEDASVDALIGPEASSRAVSEKMMRLGAAAHAISALIAAASALNRKD